MQEVAATTALLKNSAYVVVFIASIEYLGFDPEMLGVLVILMIMDIFTAIIRVWLNEGGRNIRSSVLKKGITAKLLLWAALFAVAITSKVLGFEMHEFAAGVVSIIILGELYSVLGNIHSARTGSQKVEFDAVAWMLGRIKELLMKAVK